MPKKKKSMFASAFILFKKVIKMPTLWYPVGHEYQLVIIKERGFRFLPYHPSFLGTLPLIIVGVSTKISYLFQLKGFIEILGYYVLINLYILFLK